MARLTDKKTVHELMGNTPSLWFGQADTLLKSAAVLFESRHAIPHSVWVVLMLRAYAVENLLKCICAERGHKFSVEGRYVGPRDAHSGAAIQDHNLVALNRGLGIPSNSHRDLMLHALARSMQHLGRYPMPRRHEDTAVHQEGEPDRKSMWSPEYEREFWAYITELGGVFKFLEQLPPGFFSTVMTTTWQRPWRGDA
jgi:hypothetical protein